MFFFRSAKKPLYTLKTELWGKKVIKKIKMEMLASLPYIRPCTVVPFACGYELLFHLTATLSRNMINMLG